MADIDIMITELRTAIGVDISQDGWADPDCLLLLNRSWWELMNKIDYKEKEQQTALVTVAGQTAYDLPAKIQAIQHITITAENGYDVQELQKASLLDVESWTPNDLQGLPTYYFRRDNQVVFAPPPDQVYNAIIFTLTTLDDLISGAAYPLQDEVWWEVILLGGVWRGYNKIGDLDRANLVINQQTRLINTTILPEELEIMDTRNAGIQVGRPYNQIVTKRSLWR